MILVQFGEDFFHDGLAHEGGLGADAEAGAVLVNGGELAVVEVEDVAVLAQEHELLLGQVLWVYARYFLAACHLSELYVAVLDNTLFVKLDYKREVRKVKGIKDLLFLGDLVHVYQKDLHLA